MEIKYKQMRKLYIVSILSIFLFLGCFSDKEISISGETMGTFYHVKIIAGYFKNVGEIKSKIDKRLDEINESMSFYIPDSEISRFNDSFKKDEKFEISEELKKVIKEAYKIYNLSDGAWDCTVKDLIDLWGFGKKFQKDTVPDELSIKKTLLNTGFDKIKFIDDKYLVKEKNDISIDLSSIAKGYGVDEIAKVIKENGFKNFIVEIGGEVYASGFKTKSEKWKVGIENPDRYGSERKIRRTVELTDMALAASGNYRNFFKKNGKIYSHIINPKTGYPVDNNIVSAAVISNNCMTADGLATALMVMGAAESLNLINSLDNTECYIITEKNGEFKEYYSDNFPK